MKKTEGRKSRDTVPLTIIEFADIIFNFRTTYVNEKGEVVYNYRNIAINYLTGKI
jgi:hypothetical protein